MAEVGLPMVLMGRGAWQKLAEPNRIGDLMFEMGDITLYAWSLIISGAFVLFGLCLSCYLLFDHLSGYNNPKVRLLSRWNKSYCSSYSLSTVRCLR